MPLTPPEISPPESAQYPIMLPPIRPSASTNSPPALPGIRDGIISAKVTKQPHVVEQGFETDMIRQVYNQWMCGVMELAMENTTLFHSIMAFSFELRAMKTGTKTYSHEADKNRYIAVQLLQQYLNTDCNISDTDTIVTTALILCWDSFFQSQNMQMYLTLSQGIGAVLEKVTLANSQTTSALCMKNALFQSMKSISMPAYSPDFLQEMLAKIHGIGQFIAGAQDPNLVAQHSQLYKYVADIAAFVASNARVQTKIGTAYYSPLFLFEKLQEWVKTFPSEALVATRDPTRVHSVVLYVYYDAVTRCLEALFPEIRYLFQIGFIGSVDLVGVDNIYTDAVAQQPGAASLVYYPLKVSNFFKERLFHLNRLLMSDGPSVSVTGPKQRIIEQQLTTFESAIIGPDNFPSTLPGTPDSGAVLAPALQTPDGSTTTASSSDLDPLAAEAKMFHGYYADRLEILKHMV